MLGGGSSKGYNPAAHVQLAVPFRAVFVGGEGAPEPDGSRVGARWPEGGGGGGLGLVIGLGVAPTGASCNAACAFFRRVWLFGDGVHIWS